jgi:NAD(P)-dependent dehydrogenase (short-subunit alcohol dehydrogenase family)
MKQEIHQMVRQGNGGSIVNTASVAGLVGFPLAPAYVASKFGVVGLSKTAALEYAEQGIRVNAVCPGVIETPMVDRIVESGLITADAYRAMEPIGRFGKPAEIGEAVSWLLSDESSFVTGVALPVDGGLVAR